MRYSALPGHTTDLADALNDVLTRKWRETRGIEIVNFGVSSVSALPEDEAMLKELQRNAVFRNPNMAAAHLVGAQAEAMQSAAKDEGQGSFMAFAGMNMANQAGGTSAQNLFQMGQQMQQAPTQSQPSCVSQQAPASDGWTCACGHENDGKFCVECGTPKPADGWSCVTCGMINKGKFCMECGAKKPAAEPLYRCDKCGWEPQDPKNPPKFCPECGDPFNDADIIS